MKNEKEIMSDIEFLIKKAQKERKKKPKLDRYTEAINIVKNLSPERIKEEFEKLISKRELLEKRFSVYLENFTDFNISNKEQHKKEVYKRYKKDFRYTELNRRIKNLEYLINN